MDQSGRLAAGGTASITTARSTLISRGNLTTGNSTNRQSYFDRKTLARSLSPEMIEPVPARRTVPPRSPPCTSSLQALKMMHTLPSEPTLSTWSARAPTRGVFLTGKMKFQDPEAQRAHAARNIALRPEPYRDPCCTSTGCCRTSTFPGASRRRRRRRRTTWTSCGRRTGSTPSCPDHYQLNSLQAVKRILLLHGMEPGKIL
ncbi:unnamed protein product [Heterosigma akashiwo]